MSNTIPNPPKLTKTGKIRKQRGPKKHPKILDISIPQLKILASYRLTDEQIAKVLGISVRTLDIYKKHENISAALKEGKEIADARIVRSLAERALGYSHPEDDIRVVDGRIVITPTIKHYPPDPTSCIFWLKNRQPKEWRDRTEIDVEHVLRGFSDQQLGELIADLTNKAGSDPPNKG